MAKKAVASLQTGSKRLTKVVRMIKSPKSGAYTFEESVMDPDKVNDFLNKKQIFLIFTNKATFTTGVAFSFYICKYLKLKALISDFFIFSTPGLKFKS